jgi:hypothetical protein
MIFKVYPNDDPDTAAKKIHEDWIKDGWFSIPKNKNESRAKEKEKSLSKNKTYTLSDNNFKGCYQQEKQSIDDFKWSDETSNEET